MKTIRFYDRNLYLCESCSYYPRTHDVVFVVVEKEGGHKEFLNMQQTSNYPNEQFEYSFACVNKVFERDLIKLVQSYNYFPDFDRVCNNFDKDFANTYAVGMKSFIVIKIVDKKDTSKQMYFALTCLPSIAGSFYK